MSRVIAGMRRGELYKKYDKQEEYGGGRSLGNLDEQTRRVTEYYRKEAEKYDEGFAVPYWRIYHEITWRYIQPYLPKSGTVLDAGGGTGKWAIPMAERGLRVIIYDVSKEMLNVALKKVKKFGLENFVQVREGDVCSISFPDNYFDFVLAEGDLISYCSIPDKAVRELYRVLKPCCFIAAGVDNLFAKIRYEVNAKNDLDTAFKILNKKRFYTSQWNFFCWVFTPKTLRQLFENHGFQVIKIVGKPVVFSKETTPILEDSDKMQKLIQLELMLCEEESLIGYGGHLHIVAKKQ